MCKDFDLKYTALWHYQATSRKWPCRLPSVKEKDFFLHWSFPSLTQQQEDEPDNKQPGDHLGHGKEDCTENVFLAMLAVIICTVILPRANVEVFQTCTPDPSWVRNLHGPILPGGPQVRQGSIWTRYYYTVVATPLPFCMTLNQATAPCV